MTALPEKLRGFENYILLGESGSGKSEIAINLAAALSAEKPTELYDLDQTKPMFRSRDRETELGCMGLSLRYERQFYDAPTAVGGVRESLRNQGTYTVLDVGGDAAGAELIGGYAPLLQGPGSLPLYVVNFFRPWSRSVESIDRSASQIAACARLQRLHWIANPNVGPETTAEEVLDGLRRTEHMLGPYLQLEALCVREALYEPLRRQTDIPILPLRLYMGYEWEQ